MPNAVPPGSDRDPIGEVMGYAALGWPVFPVHTPRQGGGCTCGKPACRHPGKHPRVRGWPEAASTDPATLERWWDKWPDANVGLACGARSGVVALDIDPRAGGDESLHRLQREHGGLPETVEVLTGGGGRHLWFRHPGAGLRVANSAGTIAPGIDVKGDGGFVLLPRSLHESGWRYEWELSSCPGDVPLAPLPEWLGVSVTEKAEKAEKSRDNRSNLSAVSALSVTGTATGTATGTQRDFDALVDEAIRTTIPTAHGRRHHQVFQYARALKAVPALADAGAADLMPLVKLWHTAALPSIGTKPFPDTWLDFRTAWDRVKYPRGKGPIANALAAADAAALPPGAEAYGDADTFRVLKLCRELQRTAGGGPFFLSCWTVAELLGMNRMTAWRRLRMLAGDGWIVQTEAGTTRRATRYRYAARAPWE